MRFGVDIGGTNIKFVVVDGEDIKYKNCIDTPKGGDKLVQAIADEYNKVSEEYRIEKMGVGIPGDVRNGVVLCASNLGLDNFPLAKKLTEFVEIPVKIANDADCAAMGEEMFGATKDCDNMVLVTLGTGIGGGVILNRKIMQTNKCSGEIGHIIIEMNGRQCTCGEKGCWEPYGSITALVKDAEKAADENPDSILANIYKREGRMSGRLFFEALDKGCIVANKVFDTYLDYLATGIKSINMVFGPDAIVLAGGITKEGEKILKPLRKKLRADIRLEVSVLQSDAGSLGAAML